MIKEHRQNDRRIERRIREMRQHLYLQEDMDEEKTASLASLISVELVRKESCLYPICAKYLES